MQPFRVNPNLPVASYKTYRIVSPVTTHYRDASCQEVECLAHAHGWHTTVDVSSELGAQQANYIRLHSKRRYTVVEVDTIVTFTFPSGQKCFQQHKLPLERPEIYIVRDGDWRGNPTGRSYRHTRGVDWRDDFGEHQQKLADRIERG